MPTLVHEAVAQRFLEHVSGLKLAVKGLANTDGLITTFFDNLLAFGSGTVKYRLRGQLVRRDPDLRLDLVGGVRTQPTLVVESAYSQTAQEMKAKLKEYIDGTNGAIVTALGFDMDYPSAQGIRVTVLRAQFNAHDMYAGASEEVQVYFSVSPPLFAVFVLLTLDQEIRTSEGSMCSTSAALNLSLRDLGFPGPHPDASLQLPLLVVSAKELCGWVDQAVKYAEAGTAAASE